MTKTTPAFSARFRVVGNNSPKENAPEKNLIIDFTVDEAMKCADWLLRMCDNASIEQTKIRIYTNKKEFHEESGFSIWGGMWGNSGRLQPLNPKEASERTVDIKANQDELPATEDDLPF